MIVNLVESEQNGNLISKKILNKIRNDRRLSLQLD